MASPVYIWFTTEVIKWRSLAASLWSIICLPALIFVMSLLLSISFSHPLVWISDTVNAILSLQFLYTFLTFMMAIITVTWFSLSYFCVKQEIDSSRFSCVLGLFRWSRLPLLVICLVNGSVCGWSLAKLAGEHLTFYLNTPEFEKTVLNEDCLFMNGCGIFTGFCYYWHFFINHEYYLSFPSLQRLKLFQVRSESKTMAAGVAWRTLHVMKYYYIMYFLFGSLPRIWICSSFGISEDTESAPLDSIVGLFSLSLFWKTYLLSFMYTFTLSFTIVVSRIFHTEHLEFPVISIMEDSSDKTLPDGLSCTYAPLLQHHAFYDLSCLSKITSPRLQEVLSLSQPGGHPKMWMAVSGSAIRVIRELTHQVKEENWSIMSKVPVNPHRNGVPNGNGFYMAGSTGDRMDSSLVYRGDVSKGGVHPEMEEVEKTSIVSQWISGLSFVPLLSQMMEQSQDVNSRRLFASCQVQIWAIESLSHIAARAYTEDRYGIVQSSLPLIFLSLLDLHESLEKHFKLSTSSRRTNGSLQSPNDCVIRYKLHSVLKAALYRILNTYKAHLEDMKLTPEEIRKLTPFIQYTS